MSEAPSLIEAADAAGAEPEPEPEPEPEAMEDGEGDDDDDEEGADGDDGGEEMAGPAGLRKSRGNKYAAATSEDAFANLLTGDSQVQRAQPFPAAAAVDEEGNYRITLDKKSPTAVSAWQKRWCVFTPEGLLFYFDSHQASRGPLEETDAKKEPLDLKGCQRVTSNNMQSCHVEFDLGGKKSVQLRVSKDMMQLPTGSVIKRYDKSKLVELQEALYHLERTGVLPCDGTIEDSAHPTRSPA